MWTLSVLCVLMVARWTKGQTEADCRDVMDNCAAFDNKVLCGEQYLQFAAANCRLTCGICQGPPTTPLPCIDVLNNCASYGSSACTEPMYVQWARTNCRRTCRICPKSVLDELDALGTTTMTIAPEDCVDKLDCRLYPKDTSCSGQYEAWAKTNCPLYCGFCQGLPTTPKPCLDTVPNCNAYENDVCTSQDFRIWAEDHCRKFCGFCTVPSSGGAPPLLTVQQNTPPPPGRK